MTTPEVGVLGAHGFGPATGSGDDFESWMTARQHTLQRTAYLLCSGDPHAASDLAQATLAKMYLAWPKIKDRDHVDAYARRVMVNEHRSLWRRAFRRHEVVSEQLPEGDVRDREYDGEREALWQLVQTLPRRQREVIVLRYYEELTEAETADALGISVGTVKSQASRALAALRTRVPDQITPPTHPREEDR